jgi:predicted CXXCH cytochrome family protein
MAAGVERVECLNCHATHGAVSTSLVRAEVGTGEACAVCHAGVSPERNARSHPVDRRLADPAVVARLRAKGAFLAGAGSVTCLTCHDVHESVGREGLTRHLEDAERCLVCHRERGALAGGAHDLEAGRDGPVDSACRACHAVHAASGPALSVTAGRKGDPTDCLGCHGGRGMARAAVSPGRGHPLFEENDGTAKIPSVGDSGCLPLGTRGSSGCLTCHDPHAAPSHGGGAMLRMPSADADTCVACHPEKASTRGTDHDLREHASPLAQKRGRSMARGGFCLACHGFHERDGWRLLDLPPSGGAGENPAERACLACHRSEGTAKATVVRVWEHPGDLLLTTASLPWRNTGELPLFDARGERTADTQIGRIACLTCHDPHVWSPKQGGQGGAGDGDIRTSFLREGWEPFCSGCHGEDALNAYRSYHDPAYREKARARARRGQWPIYGEEQP